MKQKVVDILLKNNYSFNKQNNNNKELIALKQHIREKEQHCKNIAEKANTTAAISVLCSPMLCVASGLTYAINPELLTKSPGTFIFMGTATAAGFATSIIAKNISNKYRTKRKAYKYLKEYVQGIINGDSTLDNTQVELINNGTINSDVLTEIDKILNRQALNNTTNNNEYNAQEELER